MKYCRKCGIKLNRDNLSASRLKKWDWICKTCNTEKLKALPSKPMTQERRIKFNASRREWKSKNRGKLKGEQKKYRSNWQVWYDFYSPDPVIQKSWKESLTYLLPSLQTRRKTKAIEHYGGKCACCGETCRAFLVIDHVNGGGNAHRKSIGERIGWWLEKNDYPEGFQVLCWNCNSAKHIYGVCPHKDSSV